MIVAGFKTAADGIAREATLLQEAKPSLLVWRADENALVVPRALARRAGFADAATNAHAAGWAMTTRGSGGGIVPQGPGTLNLAMVVPCPPGFSTEDGYQLICGALTESLTRFDITSDTGARHGVFCDGDWNILVGGRKLAGTAQRWSGSSHSRVALIHAMILMDTPDPGLWPVMQQLHEIALPQAPIPQAQAHVALHGLMPETMATSSFPGALIRAAEDRLTTVTRQKREAA